MFRLLLLASILVISLDTLMVAAWVGWIPVKHWVSDESVARRASKVIVDYYQQTARSAKVHNTRSVRMALKGMEKAIAGKTMSAMMAELVNESRNVESAIGSEKRRLQRETVLKIIGSDPEVRKNQDMVGTVAISDQEVVAGKELLSLTSIKRLKEEPVLQGMAELVTVGIEKGQARILSPPRELEYYQSMESELEQARERLQKVREASGEVALEGSGVIIQAADAPGGYLWEQIVHEQDIREILNNLYFAGARGVEIGGQRMGTGGWVRCVGPVVVVNGKTVAANPIVIKAVGSEAQLKESLVDLQEVFALTGKSLDIRANEHIALLPR